MSSESIYPDDWNSCSLNSQLNAWKLEDDINRIDAKVDDFLSGISFTDSASSAASWRLDSRHDASEPLRRFQTPAPRRTSPTPLADLFSQTIDIAEVNSESWRSSMGSEGESDDLHDNPMQNTTEPSEGEVHSESLEAVEFKPQDMFAFSEENKPSEQGKSSEQNKASEQNITAKTVSEAEKTTSVPKLQANESPQEQALAPQLIVETEPRQATPTLKRPLLTLSVGISICGVGMVFGSQIMHNTTLVNPGKSLIIAGVVGLMVSCLMFVVGNIARRKTA